MQLLTILLQDAGAGAGGMGMGMGNMLFFLGIILIFYFFMIRPQTKKQKEERLFREALTKGDKVITIGGLHGKISALEEHTAILQVDDSTKIRVEKSALRAAPAPAEKKAEKK